MVAGCERGRGVVLYDLDPVGEPGLGGPEHPVAPAWDTLGDVPDREQTHTMGCRQGAGLLDGKDTGSM